MDLTPEWVFVQDSSSNWRWEGEPLARHAKSSPESEFGPESGLRGSLGDRTPSWGISFTSPLSQPRGG